MIIDVHNHPNWIGYDCTRCLANMDEYGIDRTWILSWECPEHEIHPAYKSSVPYTAVDGPIPFAGCLEYYRRAPERFVLGYAPDPRLPMAIERLNAAIDTYGVRVYGELKIRLQLDDWDALRMYRFCGDKGLPVLVHLDYEFPSGHDYPRPNYWYGGGLESLVNAARACPETVFIGHGPGFWAHISADGKYDKEAYPTGPVIPDSDLVQGLRECPNLYCDISAGSGRNALSRDLDFTRDFLTEFQDRVMYGRDFFDNLHQELLYSLGLPAEVLDKILCGNALRLVPV